MATKISISKALEAKIRQAHASTPADEVLAAVEVVAEVIRLLDASHSKPAGSGLPAKPFVDQLVAAGVVLILPKHGGASRTYGRLAKVLRDYAVTKEQTAAAALWLKQQQAAPGMYWKNLALENLVTRLPTVLTSALGETSARPAKKVQWEDA